MSQAHRAAAGGFQGDECSTYVTFLKAPLEETEVSALRALESDTDRFVVAERELYWLLAGKLSASPLFKGNDVTRALKGVEHTQRNLSSLEKLLAKHGPGA